MNVATGCPTRYRTRHFFNNSNTNEDIATKFEQEYVRCVRNEDEMKRVTYCRWSQTLLKENPGILNYTWFSDEAWFHLWGTLILKIPVFGQAKIPTRYMKNPLI